ncbi:MAG: hypothetical protein LBP33_07625 [Candidatus Adiutrix sp.]|jgi:hypothetical protein|nr:hypothetical protein [Candidatus Adiutrix sp.]
MTSLIATRIESREEVFDLETGAPALTEWFNLFGPRAVYLLEATDRAEMGRFEAGARPALEGCFSLIVCDQEAELRLEKGPFESRARVRLLREGRGDVAVLARESSYYLRDHFQKKVGRGARLVFREYFREDRHGWHSFEAGRLAGLKGGGE